MKSHRSFFRPLTMGLNIALMAVLMVSLAGHVGAAPPAGPTLTVNQINLPLVMKSYSDDCRGTQPGDKLLLMYKWSGYEQENFNKVIKPFVDACGVQVTAVSSRDEGVLDALVVQGTPPDVLFWPTFNPIKLYSSRLFPLDTLGAYAGNYPSIWTEMGTKDGKLLALPFKADVKSIIWYNPTRFAALGYTVPTTFTGLQTLVDEMVADGHVPWSMGFNNGGPGDGWTGSDFIQDVLLATQGPGYVNQIISGTTLYNDTGVFSAYQIYKKWAADPEYTVGGANGTVNTNFLDAIYKVFSNPPEALMVKQSGFAGGAIAMQFPSLKYGTDYDFFQFPGVQGLQGGADFIMAFSNKPATRALIAYLTSARGALNMAATNWGLSPNINAAGHYTDPQISKLGDMLANAPAFTFDIGDTLGAPFYTAEWQAIINIVMGQDIKTNLDAAAVAQLEALE